MLLSRTIQTPLCVMRAATSNRGICLLEMGSPERAHKEQAQLEAAFETKMIQGNHPLLDHLESELQQYFRGELTSFTIPLDTPGSQWQTRVWTALNTIPYGQTLSYGQLAARLDNPGGARAVGLANGQNRVSILIPCHRVIASDGTLHGYGGGLPRKRWLLDHESTHSGSGLFTHAQHQTR
ncbi:MAG: methylated-DNA--[protein]-cysteine S-methyltransferase [Phycisphaerales bacterium]